VKPGFDARFSGFYFAGDISTDAPFGPQRDQRGLGMLSILRFERRLQGPQLVSVHWIQSWCRGVCVKRLSFGFGA
jgi:hypothetical protein